MNFEHGHRLPVAPGPGTNLTRVEWPRNVLNEVTRMVGLTSRLRQKRSAQAHRLHPCTCHTSPTTSNMNILSLDSRYTLRKLGLRPSADVIKALKTFIYATGGDPARESFVPTYYTTVYPVPDISLCHAQKRAPGLARKLVSMISPERYTRSSTPALSISLANRTEKTVQKCANQGRQYNIISR